MPKPLVRLMAVLAILGLFASLGAGSATAASPNATEVYRITLTGDQEATATCAPPDLCGDEDASGAMILTVNPNTDTVCFLTRWADIDGTVTAAHIHNGVAGVPAGVVVPLFSGTFGSSDQLRGCVDGMGWTDDINLNPAGFYVNIHSTTFPAGAIRGQLG